MSFQAGSIHMSEAGACLGVTQSEERGQETPCPTQVTLGNVWYTELQKPICTGVLWSPAHSYFEKWFRFHQEKSQKSHWKAGANFPS